MALDRYRIDIKRPGGQWEVHWDEMARSPQEAIRINNTKPGSQFEKGTEKRAQIDNSRKLFGT